MPRQIGTPTLHAASAHSRAGVRELRPLFEAPPAMLGLTQLSNYRTLKGSFSAVSKPHFASKYALELGSI